MSDDFLIDNLHDIVDAIELISIRFSKIVKADDFLLTTDGVLLLDSICMRLQVIGESLKIFLAENCIRQTG